MVLFTPLFHSVAQLADIETKVAKSRDHQNNLLDRRNSAEEAYRREAIEDGIAPEQVDVDIEKARQSPQSNKLLLDIHNTHTEALPRFAENPFALMRCRTTETRLW